MSNFLEGYEDVNARITRARAEYPGLRLVAYIEDISLKDGYILVRAEAYKNYDDEKPSAVDYALEVRSDRGVNANFWVENCVTSAYGRVIGLLTPGGIGRPTRQDMDKAQSFTGPTKPTITATKDLDLATLQTKLGAKELISEPRCKHGFRMLLEGIGKTGAPYKGWMCREKVKANQCQPIWMRKYDAQWLMPEDYTEVITEAGLNLDPVAKREPVPEAFMSDSERAARGAN